MLAQGILNQSALQSIVLETSVIGPKNQRLKRNIVADLLLTALIDAFSILVIFLLMSFSSSGELLMAGGIELPKSSQTVVLERFPVIKIDEGKVYLEDKEVKTQDLTAALMDLRKKFQEQRPGEAFHDTITVQADRRLKYEFMNQVIAAASQAGISDIKFAVLMN